MGSIWCNWKSFRCIRNFTEVSWIRREHSEYGLVRGWEKYDCGDFLTWVLRTSLDSTGLWKSDAQINELFAQVNEEISQAFVDGTSWEGRSNLGLSLPEEVGRLAEILELQDEITQTYRTSILMEGYVAQKGQTEYNRPGILILQPPILPIWIFFR